MAGRHQLDLLRLEQAQGGHEGGEGVVTGRDDGRAQAEDEVAAEADTVFAEEADVVSCVAGRGEDTQTAVGLAVLGEQDRRGVTSARGRHRRDERLGPSGVVPVGVGKQDHPEPTALRGGGADRLQVPRVLGTRIDHDTGVRPI